MSVISDIFAGGAAGIFSGIRGLIGAFKADPTVSAQLAAAVAQAEMDLSAKLAAADAAQIAAVNATMQAEAKSEHWAQWSWRPVVGFTFSAVVINNYLLYAYLAKLGVVKIDLPSELWIAFMAILGVAAYVRGRDRKANGNGNGAAPR